MLLNDDQILIRDSARRFAREQLAPYAAQWDRDATFPAEQIRAMGELGLLGVVIPEEYDGAGADHVAYAAALEEIAAGDASCAIVMSLLEQFDHAVAAIEPRLRFGVQFGA